MKTMNTRSSGSAHRGLGEWLLQRLSALYLAGFAVWLVVWLAMAAPADYTAWKAWMAAGGVRLAFALFFLSVLVHSWVGMRSVFLDYLKPLWVRTVAQMLLAFGLLALAFWAAQILLVEARV
jgi:succinate dehydrogenase / fumarate reductase, membrane anchor subunit